MRPIVWLTELRSSITARSWRRERPQELKEQTGTESLEDAFLALTGIDDSGRERRLRRISMRQYGEDVEGER